MCIVKAILPHMKSSLSLLIAGWGGLLLSVCLSRRHLRLPANFSWHSFHYTIRCHTAKLVYNLKKFHYSDRCLENFGVMWPLSPPPPPPPLQQPHQPTHTFWCVFHVTNLFQIMEKQGFDFHILLEHYMLNMFNLCDMVFGFERI